MINFCIFIISDFVAFVNCKMHNFYHLVLVEMNKKWFLSIKKQKTSSAEAELVWFIGLSIWYYRDPH